MEIKIAKSFLDLCQRAIENDYLDEDRLMRHLESMMVALVMDGLYNNFIESVEENKNTTEKFDTEKKIKELNNVLHISVLLTNGKKKMLIDELLASIGDMWATADAFVEIIMSDDACKNLKG